MNPRPQDYSTVDKGMNRRQNSGGGTEQNGDAPRVKSETWAKNKHEKSVGDEAGGTTGRGRK